MSIRISDKSLCNGELILKVLNFIIIGEEMFFELDNSRLGDFISTAVANGLVKSAFRKDGASEWSVKMDVKYLTGMIYDEE